MTLIDDRGRVFGRVNLVDAVLLAVFVGLVPLAYGGYALFRTPPPRLTSVQPQKLVLDGSGVQRVTVHGENLRPYLRVSFGDYQGRSFLFQNPTTAQIEIGDIVPGTYDVVLYDYAQERARLPKAITFTASTLPVTSVIVVGRVGNLTQAVARQIVAGLKLNQYGAVLEAGTPAPQVTRLHAGAGLVDTPIAGAYQVPVTIKVPCGVLINGGQPTCTINGVTLAPDMFLQLDTAIGPYSLQIDQVLGSEPIVDVQAVIRLGGSPGTLGLVRAGDVDIGLSRNELAAGGRVAEVTPMSSVGRDVTVDLRAQKGADGWLYQGTPLRAGGMFALRTKAYELVGTVLRVTPEIER